MTKIVNCKNKEIVTFSNEEMLISKESYTLANKYRIDAKCEILFDEVNKAQEVLNNKLNEFKALQNELFNI